MSGASNGGYGEMFPNSNVNRHFVNVGGTNNPSNFGSNEVPGFRSRGGAKYIKRKIKNITKKYKRMKRMSKSKLRTIKNRVKARYMSRSLALGKSQVGGRRRYNSRRRSQNRRRTQRQRGGHYSQYQNNMPLTQSYSVGGILSPDQSMMASPPPITVLSGGDGNCVDNYNHNTNMGRPSIGH